MRKIKGPEVIAIDTTSGVSFEPEKQKCIGFKPMLCRPLRETVHDTCAADIVSQKSNPNCMIELSKRGNRTLDFFAMGIDSEEVILNAYITQDLSIRCTGETPRHKKILGPTKIILKSNCNLETDVWHLSGIEKGNSSLHIPVKRYFKELPKINLTWPKFNSSIVNEIRTKLQFTDRVDIPLLQLSSWVEPSFNKIDWGSVR